ncbi:unnamed protein product, partial [Rotaria sp. Silwood2]
YETLNRVQEANERWKHFFNWNLSTLDLVAKYFDQMNLCQQCINHFITKPIDEQQISTDSDEDDNDDKEEWYSNQKPTTFELCEQKIEDYLTQISLSIPTNSTIPLRLTSISSIHSTENLIKTSLELNSTIQYDPNKYTLALEEEFRHSIINDYR